MSDAAVVLHDCWNRIGVRGDRSCPELDRHVHCRNCPVHSAAAKQLLRRPVPAGYLSDATAHYASAQRRDETGVEAGSRSVLVFRVGPEWLALPCTLLNEVAECRPQHRLPHRRSGALLGIVNVRGELLVCVSIAMVLAIGANAAGRSQARRAGPARLLVLKHDQGRLACPVDEVHGVQHFDPRDLQALPATVTKAAARYTQAVLRCGERSVGLLDEQLLLYTLVRSMA
jgi:chemotaxis-related protein WspD